MPRQNLQQVRYTLWSKKENGQKRRHIHLHRSEEILLLSTEVEDVGINSKTENIENLTKMTREENNLGLAISSLEDLKLNITSTVSDMFEIPLNMEKQVQSTWNTCQVCSKTEIWSTGIIRQRRPWSYGLKVWRGLRKKLTWRKRNI